MRRMNFPGKMLLITTSFVIPMILLLGSMITTKLENIQIIQKEVDEFILSDFRTSSFVENIDIDSIINSHRQWKIKLRESIEAKEKVDVQTLCRDDCCVLGKWIYSDGKKLRTRKSFTDLVTNHANFHKVAGQVGLLINEGKFKNAEEALAPNTPFANATSDVLLILSSVKRLGFV